MKNVFTVFKTLYLSLIVVCILNSCTVGLKGDQKDTVAKPNIIIINVDDLGWKDLGYMGSKYYETPVLDKLASEGLVFKHAYAAAANCAPSRACLMSGMNTPRHGIYTVWNSDRGRPESRKIIPTPNTEVLADSIYTLAELLRDNGYITGTFGKWHLGEDPTTQGFKVNVGGSHHGSPGENGYFSPYNIDYIKDGPEGEYLTDRLTTEAIQFVRDYKDTTFFLYLPFYSVHTPIMGRPDLVEKFKNKKGMDGHDNPEYAAMVASVDMNIGRLLDELDQHGLRQNTVIFFTSDNGGIRDISYQDPLRAGKGSYYEGGIRVPLIISWPERVNAGTTDEPVTNMDFYPTIHRIIQAKQKVEPLDGNDIFPLFSGEMISERALFWHFPIYLQAYNPKEDEARDPLFRTRPGSVIRKGKWKLHEYFENMEVELFNLESDPSERNNIAAKYPQVAKEMLMELNQWRRKMNAPVPTQPNPLYDRQVEVALTEQALK